MQFSKIIAIVSLSATAYSAAVLPRLPASPPPTPLATRPAPPPSLAAPAASLACCARSTFLVASAPTMETPTAARTAQTVSSSTSRTALPSCKLATQQGASDTRPKSPVYTGRRRQGGYEALMRSLVFGNFVTWHKNASAP